MGALLGLDERWSWPGWTVLAQLLAAAAFLSVGYLMIIAAMRLGEMSAIVPFRYSNVVFAIVLGVLVWGDIPDAVTIAGSAIIIATGLYTLYRERKVAAAPPHAARSGTSRRPDFSTRNYSNVTRKVVSSGLTEDRLQRFGGFSGLRFAPPRMTTLRSDSLTWESAYYGPPQGRAITLSRSCAPRRRAFPLRSRRPPRGRNSSAVCDGRCSRAEDMLGMPAAVILVASDRRARLPAPLDPERAQTACMGRRSRALRNSMPMESMTALRH